MSRHRVTPGRGYVIPALLPRGPNGRALCRFCQQEVQPPRKTFCGDACVHEWKLRTQPAYARFHVWCRDRGRCAACHKQTGQRWWGPHSLEWYYRRACRSYALNGWAMDHTLAVEEGGGECGLEGLQTLCHPCHRHKTRAHAGRRAERRKTPA